MDSAVEKEYFESAAMDSLANFCASVAVLVEKSVENSLFLKSNVSFSASTPLKFKMRSAATSRYSGSVADTLMISSASAVSRE